MRPSDLQRLAGRVLCVGFPGTSPSEVPLARLADLAPGGVMLFARNVTSIEETARLTTAVVKAIATIGNAPFVGIDQEGGRVARLRRGVAVIPAMMALGASGDVAAAEHVGEALAADVRRVGVTVNFAPVLDLATEPRNTVIGTRSFGDDPAMVGVLGAALVRGLQRGGVAAVGKHFPGHGATAIDSHLALPRIDVDNDTLRAREFVPFTAAIAAGVAGIMTAHVLLPALDPQLPATVSGRILTGCLRDELDFHGVCFTDCLEMDAIAQGVGIVRAAVLALIAGADSLLISHTLDAAFAARDAICAAVESGELSLARLASAADQVTRLSGARGRAPAPVAGTGDVGRMVAKNAITLVRGAPSLQGVRPVTIISFEGERSDGIRGREVDHTSLNIALRTRRIRSEIMRVPLDPDQEMIAQLRELLVMQGERDIVLLMRAAHVHPAQRAAVEAMLTWAPQAIVVSAREPFDAAGVTAQTLLCTYGDDEPTMDALADVLVGRAAATGRLPVRLTRAEAAP